MRNDTMGDHKADGRRPQITFKSRQLNMKMQLGLWKVRLTHDDTHLVSNSDTSLIHQGVLILPVVVPLCSSTRSSVLHFSLNLETLLDMTARRHLSPHYDVQLFNKPTQTVLLRCS